MSDHFPILHRAMRIPWALIEAHERQARLNHGQAVARLAERGGLSDCEAVAIIEDREWRQMPKEEAAARLEELVRLFHVEAATADLRRALAAIQAENAKLREHLRKSLDEDDKTPIAALFLEAVALVDAPADNAALVEVCERVARRIREKSPADPEFGRMSDEDLRAEVASELGGSR